MRNIDYRALYQQVVENEVDPKKRKGTYDKKTHDERTKDAIEGNAARKAGQKINDPNKKSVAPVEPENLKVVDIDEEFMQRLVDAGHCRDLESAKSLIDFIESTS